MAVDEAPPVDGIAWRRAWTIPAGELVLRPATLRLARAVIDRRLVTGRFAEGFPLETTATAMGFALRDISSGAAAVMPTVWLVIRGGDGLIIGDAGIHGVPDADGAVEIGYALVQSEHGRGVGTAAIGALVQRLASDPGVRRITAVTGARNVPSRRLLDRLGFTVAATLEASDELRYEMEVGERRAVPAPAAIT